MQLIFVSCSQGNVGAGGGVQSLIHFYGIGFLIRIDTKSVKSLVLKKFVIISILQNIAFEKFKNMELKPKDRGKALERASKHFLGDKTTISKCKEYSAFPEKKLSTQFFCIVTLCLNTGSKEIFIKIRKTKIYFFLF